MKRELKQMWELLTSKPEPKRMPFGVTERASRIFWGVYSGSTLLHLSFTYHGAEKWRFECMILGIQEGM